MGSFMTKQDDNVYFVNAIHFRFCRSLKMLWLACMQYDEGDVA